MILINYLDFVKKIHFIVSFQDIQRKLNLHVFFYTQGTNNQNLSEVIRQMANDNNTSINIENGPISNSFIFTSIF